MNEKKRYLNYILVFVVIALMGLYFIIATPKLMDDGFAYQGFTESLARGELDFGTYYGFQGLSFFAVLVFWLTRSEIAIVITSAIFALLSIPLAYGIGKEYYNDSKAGMYFVAIFLLTAFPYTTMMRGFQEAALLFFILLIIYGSIKNKFWTPVFWAVGGIVKPFALVLFPLFIKDFFSKKRVVWVVLALFIGAAYLGANYYQTGNLVNNAAIGSYRGHFDTNEVPSLVESFKVSYKGFGRILANSLASHRKIMVSPLLVIIGAVSLLKNTNLKLRKEIVMAIILNIVLVSLLTFSFPKYLLPMTTLLSLAGLFYLIRSRWLTLLVIIDSLFVFLPIYNYFGGEFWPNWAIYFLPFYLAAFLLLSYDYLFRNVNNNTLS